MERITFLEIQIHAVEELLYKYDDASSRRKNPAKLLTVDKYARLSERDFISHILPTFAKRELTRHCKVCSSKNDADSKKSLVYADKPQTLDHLEDNIRRVIVDKRPQMLEKVIENWTSRLHYIRASRGSHMPKIIFKI
ncbi:hypothetical protein TNCV_4611721 [Trichonephila clavipes]|nr:hypothetical protein TNCV_4611721 [Trichonephila clavipes]